MGGALFDIIGASAVEGGEPPVAGSWVITTSYVIYSANMLSSPGRRLARALCRRYPGAELTLGPHANQVTLGFAEPAWRKKAKSEIKIIETLKTVLQDRPVNVSFPRELQPAAPNGTLVVKHPALPILETDLLLLRRIPGVTKVERLPPQQIVVHFNKEHTQVRLLKDHIRTAFL